MARTWSGATDDVKLDIGLIANSTFSNVSQFVVVRKTADANGGLAHVMASCRTSGGTLRYYWYVIDGSTAIEIDSNGSGVSTSGFTVTAAEGWVLIGFTKATGTVALRFHKFVFATNTWTHSAGTGTVANLSAPGAGATIELGFDTGTEHLSGTMAAWGHWERQLTDSEVERLPRGQWQELDPTEFIEFRYVHDNPTGTVRDLSRGQARQISVTGTSRSTNVGPPGFQYSIRGRRM